jgi:hypothetical protein
MALSAYALLELDEAKRAIQAGANFQEEADLVMYVNGVSELVEGICGRKFLARAYTETFDGDGTNRHRVRHAPVLPTAGESYPITVIAEDDGDAIASDTIRVNYGQGLFYLEEDIFAKGFQNCSITYSAGLTAVPETVKCAAATILGKFWRMRDKSLEHAASISVEGQTITFKPEAVPPEAIAMLAPYRRPRFA